MLKKILVPLDGSKLSEAVLPYVRTLAQSMNALSGSAPRRHGGGLSSVPIPWRRCKRCRSGRHRNMIIMRKPKAIFSELPLIIFRIPQWTLQVLGDPPPTFSILPKPAGWI